MLRISPCSHIFVPFRLKAAIDCLFGLRLRLFLGLFAFLFACCSWPTDERCLADSESDSCGRKRDDIRDLVGTSCWNMSSSCITFRHRAALPTGSGMSECL